MLLATLLATLLSPSPTGHQAVAGRTETPRHAARWVPWGTRCPQYLLFFRPEEEEEDLPGLKGLEPDELLPPWPLGFLGAGLSLSEPDEPEACFSLFLAW